ncbi:MAG: hypothetical protein SGI88_20215 [Candidatus Hydrogenedentes bacterium]|nr:hypothetical protein [Candidatus Hydrogenedentota bacterium]
MSIRRIAISITPAIVLLAGCVALDAPILSIPDARNNLSGDNTRAYLDIVQATVHQEGDFFAFSVRTASPIPIAQDMSPGKRLDFIWFVDADKNQTTGQSEAGDDFNLHLWLDGAGWHPVIFAVSDIATGRSATLSPAAPRFRVEGDAATLLVHVSTFAEAEFEWWASSTTKHAPAWLPLTENPATRRASTETLRSGAIQPTL